MEKTRKLVILGDSAFAEIAYEYFTHDSPYEVVGFSVEQAFFKRDELFGLPVVPFESIDTHFLPGEHSFFAAITYVQLNRLRTRLYRAAKNLGYRPASYVSSRAFVWRNVEMGEHCFIFEGNVVQPFARIGENVVLWSGNHIGHHSAIGANCFIASHAVVSGFVNIGENCFVGVNTTFSNNIVVGKDCLIGAGAMVARDVPEDKVVKGEAGEPTGSARRLNRVKE
ncbi:acetyltransferase [Paraburkholderia caribensis]|uniref:Sugar O-acyltransferase n=1 Tax=Paraburkholderia caribensis TaxID=75105 RepID=A0A9Q6S2B9_9BURK|nr:acetyltransferase [Paraburkholderia caribensis]QLB63245.1 sugar O-acyltransferase [Paraburkholderia caribensis]